MQQSLLLFGYYSIQIRIMHRIIMIHSVSKAGQCSLLTRHATNLGYSGFGDTLNINFEVNVGMIFKASRFTFSAD